MNRFIFKIAILLVLLAIISFYLFGGLSKHDSMKKSLQSPNSERIHIAAAFCGKINVVNRFKSLIKSVILMSEAEIEYHVIAEDLLRIEAELLYQSFPESVKKRVTFTYYSIWFPAKNYEWWKKLYRPCATEKIFFSKIIREEVDSVLYFDLDAIIVGRVEKIWAKFKEFEPQEIFGAVHDCPFPGCGYYNKMINKPVHVPAVGQSGLNSGVLFIKLDRIRNSNFLQLVEETAEKCKPNLIGAEQDVLNIIFNNFPKKLRFIDCSFNFMPHFYCKRPTICDRRNGIFVIHGAGMVFDINKDFSMTKIYKYVASIDLRRRKEAIIEELLSLVTEYTEDCDCKSIAHQIFLY